MTTSYNFQQTLNNESGWLFYDSAFKNWKVINSKLTGNSILDVGCGSGISLALSKVFNPERNYVGLEGNEESKPIWEKRGLHIITGDIYHLPFDDKSFDTVYSSHVLEHLENPKKAINETIRVARKRIIHSVPNGNVDDKNFGSKHLHHFNRLSFLQLFDTTKINIDLYTNISDIHMSSLICVADILE